MRTPINLPDSRYSDLLDFEPFSAINCIISDIDGTMVSSNKKVFEQLSYLISELQKKGVYFTIATGRTYSGAYPLLNQIPLVKGTIIALYNGSVLIEYGTNKLIQIQSICHESISNIIHLIKKYNVNTYLYSYNANSIPLLSYNNQKELTETVYGIGNRHHEKDFNGQDILWITEDEIYNTYTVSALISVNEKKNYEIEEIIGICKRFEDVRVTNSGSGYIELTNIMANKGNLIVYLKEHRPNSVVLAIGDNENDRELFTNADVGVGVLNASNAIFDIIDYIADRPDVQGFIDILTTVRNAKYYL